MVNFVLHRAPSGHVLCGLLLTSACSHCSHCLLIIIRKRSKRVIIIAWQTLGTPAVSQTRWSSNGDRFTSRPPEAAVAFFGNSLTFRLKSKLTGEVVYSFVVGHAWATLEQHTQLVIVHLQVWLDQNDQGGCVCLRQGTRSLGNINWTHVHWTLSRPIDNRWFVFSSSFVVLAFKFFDQHGWINTVY